MYIILDQLTRYQNQTFTFPEVKEPVFKIQFFHMMMS